MSDRQSPMRKTDFSPPYKRKTKYPPPPDRRRDPMTVRDCRREIGFALLMAVAFTVFALLCWHGHDGFGGTNLILAIVALTHARSAWQNLRRVQGGEIVSGELAWSYRRGELMVARFAVSGITIAMILLVIVDVTVLHDYRIWILPLVEMCLFWLLVNWSWKRHINS